MKGVEPSICTVQDDCHIHYAVSDHVVMKGWNIKGVYINLYNGMRSATVHHRAL